MPRSPDVVITASSPSPAATSAKVGAVVAVELTSASYGRDGRLVPWGTPVSSDPSVLRPMRTSPRSCPPDSTCTAFLATRAGVAAVSATGPSGIVCAKGGAHCVAVTPVMRRVLVQVQTS